MSVTRERFASAAAPPAGEPEGALPVGRRGRRLQRRILLAHRSPEGFYWLLDQFLLRPFVNALRIVPQLVEVGPRARRESGVPIRRQALDLLRLVLFHGAKPWMYYAMECYRPGAMAEAGAMIMRNEVKHGLFKALNRIDPEARDRARKLGDKLAVAEWCAEHGIRHPQPILAIEHGEVRWRGASLEDLDRDLFVKRRRGRGGYAAACYWRTAPFQYRDKKGNPVNLAQIMAELVRRSERERLMVLPLLRNHPAIADLAEEALITLRLLTCLDEERRPVLTNAYFRSVAKLEPRWNVGRIEDFAAPIDLETGALGRLTGDKPECLSDWFDRHPVTGAQVTGRIVPCWPEVVRLALKAHALVPERVLIGWDMAVTPEGAVLLEGNSFPDTIFPQRIFRQPIGRMRLGALLDFHLGRLEAKLDRESARR